MEDVERDDAVSVTPLHEEARPLLITSLYVQPLLALLLTPKSSCAGALQHDELQDAKKLSRALHEKKNREGATAGPRTERIDLADACET